MSEEKNKTEQLEVTAMHNTSQYSMALDSPRKEAISRDTIHRRIAELCQPLHNRVC